MDNNTNSVIEAEEIVEENKPSTDNEAPLDKNIKLMSPTRMVVRRFFRSKLSIIGLIMMMIVLISLRCMLRLSRIRCCMIARTVWLIQ